MQLLLVAHVQLMDTLHTLPITNANEGREARRERWMEGGREGERDGGMDGREGGTEGL